MLEEVGMSAVMQEEQISEYERMFHGREARAGRPVGSDGSEVAFSFRDKDRKLATRAKSRVYAMLIAKHRSWAREAFEQEYAILASRQGYEDIEVRKHKVEVETVRRPLQVVGDSDDEIEDD
jgi:hypothetical protein